jgi:DNA-directed RNA polymerase specialized sigma24 family protein
MKTGSSFEVTKSSLGKLLARLDGDAAEAGRKYETLRLGLVRFFEWRGSLSPSEHADEVVDRLARKLEEGEEIRDLFGYASGVARFVFLEVVKEEARQRAALRELHARPPEPPPDEDAPLRCLRRCLAALPREDGALVVRYYEHEKSAKIDRRKKLAESMGISISTLRMRMQRLRAKLEDCVAGCLGDRGGERRD